MDADARPHCLDLLLDVISAVAGGRQRHAGDDHGGAKVPPAGSARATQRP